MGQASPSLNSCPSNCTKETSKNYGGYQMKYVVLLLFRVLFPVQVHDSRYRGEAQSGTDHPYNCPTLRFVRGGT